MRTRGNGAICLIIYCMCSASLVQASTPPLHQNFAKADENEIALVSHLQNIKLLSDQALYYSYSANASITFNESTSLLYNNEFLNKSMEIDAQLKNTFPYAIDTITELYEHMENYGYLIDDYILLKHLVDNISFIIENHSSMIFFFDQLTNMTQNKTVDRQQIVESIPLGYVSLFNCERALKNIDHMLPAFSPSFSIITLQEYRELFTSLCNRYQTYFQQFLGEFPSSESRLFLFVNESNIYMGEQIFAIGYFLSNNTFIANQQISIVFNDQRMENVVTAEDGTFYTNISFSQAIAPGLHSLWSETTYQENIIKSDLISMSISLIPTFISFNLTQSDFYPGEPIVIRGNLTTLGNGGLRENITILYEDHTKILQTNKTGQFTGILPGINQCGNYSIQVKSLLSYRFMPSESTVANFSINYPTVLSLNVNILEATQGDLVYVFGRLSNYTSNESISDQEIILTVTKRVIATLKTNETGWYNFTWDTTDQAAGMLNISALFHSKNGILRSSYTQTPPILLKASFFASIVTPILLFLNQFLIPLILLVSLISLLFLFKRYHKEYGSQEMEPLLPSSPSHVKQLFFIRSQVDTLKEQYKTTTNLNQKIICGYRLFIHRLIDQGVPITKAHTHLEIKQVIKQQGYPQDSVESLTTAYEQARYAPYTAEEKDMIIFDDTLKKLIHFGRG